MPSVTNKMVHVDAIQIPTAADVTNVSLDIGIFQIVNLVNAIVML